MIIVRVMGGRRWRRVLLLHYNGATMGRSASVHRRLTLMMGSASAHGGAMVHGTAFMIHGLAFMHAGALMARAAPVLRAVFVHSRTLLSGGVLVHDRTLVTGSVFVHGRALLSGRFLVHDRTLVSRGIFVDALTLVAGVSLHRMALLPGCALLHRRSGLLAGAASLLRADLLTLGRSLAAGLTGRRCFGNSHYERGAEKARHQCNCQYLLQFFVHHDMNPRFFYYFVI